MNRWNVRTYSDGDKEIVSQDGYPMGFDPVCQWLNRLEQKLKQERERRIEAEKVISFYADERIRFTADLEMMGDIDYCEDSYE